MTIQEMNCPELSFDLKYHYRSPEYVSFQGGHLKSRGNEILYCRYGISLQVSFRVRNLVTGLFPSLQVSFPHYRSLSLITGLFPITESHYRSLSLITGLLPSIQVCCRYGISLQVSFLFLMSIPTNISSLIFSGTGCTALDYRVAKMPSMPYLDRSFSAQDP